MSLAARCVAQTQSSDKLLDECGIHGPLRKRGAALPHDGHSGVETVDQRTAQFQGSPPRQWVGFAVPSRLPIALVFDVRCGHQF